MAGFSGLVYEVVWTRILTLTFGGTVFATSTVLLAPTLLMGATLPLLTPVFTPNLRRLGRSVGTLYWVNTTGAVGGILFTTFLVLPLVGFKIGMIIAGCLNLLVACVALYYSYDLSQRLRWWIAGAFLMHEHTEAPRAETLSEELVAAAEQVLTVDPAEDLPDFPRPADLRGPAGGDDGAGLQQLDSLV